MAESERDLKGVVQAFETRKPGVRSLEMLIEDCQHLRSQDTDNAAAYALIAFTTGQVIDHFGGRATTLDEANEVNGKLLSCCKEIAASIDGAPEGKVAAMNALVLDLVD